jgi:universal stress protein A
MTQIMGLEAPVKGGPVMDLTIVLPALVAIALVFVVVPVGAAVYGRWRRPFRLTCPRTGSDAQIQVASAAAAVAAVFGRDSVDLRRCSLWSSVSGCRAECLAHPSTVTIRPMRRGEPPPKPDPDRHTILVALDGTPGAERILDVVAAVAAVRASTVRLVHVAPPVEAIRDADGQIVAFAADVTASVEYRMQDYLTRVGSRLSGVPVETVVRFGDPATEIVAEAEAAGADLVAMTRRSWPGLAGWWRTSVSRRVQRATLIPLLLASTDGRTTTTNVGGVAQPPKWSRYSS